MNKTTITIVKKLRVITDIGWGSDAYVFNFIEKDIIITETINKDGSKTVNTQLVGNGLKREEYTSEWNNMDNTYAKWSAWFDREITPRFPLLAKPITSEEEFNSTNGSGTIHYNNDWVSKFSTFLNIDALTELENKINNGEIVLLDNSAGGLPVIDTNGNIATPTRLTETFDVNGISIERKEEVIVETFTNGIYKIN